MRIQGAGTVGSAAVALAHHPASLSSMGNIMPCLPISRHTTPFEALGSTGHRWAKVHIHFNLWPLYPLISSELTTSHRTTATASNRNKYLASLQC